MMKAIRTLLITVTTAFCLAACMPQPKVTVGDYFQPDNVQAKSGMAKLYIFRKPDLGSYRKQVNIEANDKPIAVLVNGSYTSVDLKPGTYKFFAKEEGYEATGKLDAGQTYYLEYATRTAPRVGVIPDGKDPIVYTQNEVISYYFGLVNAERGYADLSFCKKITSVVPAKK